MEAAKPQIPKPKFMQIAVSGENLYALDEEGQVWQYMTQHMGRPGAFWSPIPTTTKAELNRPLGG
jgi:hypothetical protein